MARQRSTINVTPAGMYIMNHDRNNVLPFVLHGLFLRPAVREPSIPKATFFLLHSRTSLERLQRWSQYSTVQYSTNILGVETDRTGDVLVNFGKFSVVLGDAECISSEFTLVILEMYSVFLKFILATLESCQYFATNYWRCSQHFRNLCW